MYPDQAVGAEGAGSNGTGCGSSSCPEEDDPAVLDTLQVLAAATAASTTARQQVLCAGGVEAAAAALVRCSFRLQQAGSKGSAAASEAGGRPDQLWGAVRLLAALLEGRGGSSQSREHREQVIRGEAEMGAGAEIGLRGRYGDVEWGASEGRGRAVAAVTRASSSCRGSEG